MFCAISGNVPEVPVVSTKSGHLFEKTLIDKYVRETGKCPITEASLTLDDLLPMKASKTVKPRTAALSSIPGMLASFHDEWDAIMLELHTVRSQLHQTRQELAHSLYQHDAAVRVIAKLMQERDDARAQLETAKAQIRKELAEEATHAAAAAEAASAPPAKAGISDTILKELTDINQTLSKGRKKRPVPDTLATPSELSSMVLQGAYPLHSASKGGIARVDSNPSAPAVIATAGMDCSVQVFDYVQGRTLASLEGHSKRVSSVAYLSGEVLLSASADCSVKVWRGPAQQQEGAAFTCLSTLKDHTSEVVSVTPHPSHRHFVSGSADATWAFWDLDTLTCLTQVPLEAAGEAYTALQFHPDGLILGSATDKNFIRIWEIRQQKNVATFEGHSSPVRGLSFSENGYHLASVSDEGVKLWDLRKLKNFKSLAPFTAAATTCVAFDHSGQYLAVGGPSLLVYGAKSEWDEVARVADAPKKATCVRWGADAHALLVGSTDHNLRVFTV